MAYFAINLLLDNFAVNVLYLRNLNLRMLFNLLGLLFSVILLIIRLGPRKIVETVVVQIEKIKRKDDKNV